MAKKVPSQGKVVRIYEDADHKSIWTYDYSISRFGPISVEQVYKNEPATVKKKKSKKKP
jgi:hypothetical protein